jgi:hypothetical protein
MGGKGKTTAKRKPAAKAKKRTAKRPARKAVAAEASGALATTGGDPCAAAAKFERDLLIRGDAARTDEAGKLPRGATHEVVEGGKDEPPKIERRRFKMW